MMDISKNKGCAPSISHNHFSASLRQILLFLSTGRKDQTPVATLYLLLANSDFLNVVAVLGSLPTRW